MSARNRTAWEAMTTAWLIERNGIHLCYAHDGSRCGRWVVFTDPSGWRFKTEAEAEAVIAERGLPATAIEHGWDETPVRPRGE